MNHPSWAGLFKGLALSAAAGVIALATVFASPPVESVPQVDAQRYAGTWYELARMPNRFQDQCVGDVTASYRPLADGALEVVNRCREGSSRWSEVAGRAVKADESGSGARWKVSFLPRWLQWLPVARGDYWVVMLDADYRYAVVSEPGRNYLWVLSRLPTMDAATYDSIVNQLKAKGYAVEKLVRTPHRLPTDAMTTPSLLA